MGFRSSLPVEMQLSGAGILGTMGRWDDGFCVSHQENREGAMQEIEKGGGCKRRPRAGRGRYFRYRFGWKDRMRRTDLVASS